MKNIKDYIGHILLEHTDIWYLPPTQKAEFVKVLDETFNELNKSMYSLDNKNDCDKIYSIFRSKCGSLGTDKMITQKLNDVGIRDAKTFRGFILSNHDKFEKYHFKMDWVMQWNETEAEKQFKKWKDSNDYVEAIDDESAEERDLVVYDRWDPEHYEVYPFAGKRGKRTDHQVNMIRLKFHDDEDVKYYDCYPILYKNYVGHIEDIKKRAESQLGYDDPNEFK